MVQLIIRIAPGEHCIRKFLRGLLGDPSFCFVLPVFLELCPVGFIRYPLIEPIYEVCPECATNLVVVEVRGAKTDGRQTFDVLPVELPG